MSLHFDTIVAPITAVGNAAIAVIRVCGPEAWQISSQLFAPWQPESHHATYGRFGHGDDGMALPFSEGRGYTGEESVEFSVHSSPASVRALVEDCLRLGARLARPGEFTERAFLNGRLDLSQAEGVRQTIEAETEAQLRQANLHREGILQQEIQNLRTQLMTVLAHVEASVDFSEEIGHLDRTAAQETLSKVQHELERLISTAESGRLIREGIKIAIVGPPNAGKSSLLNALVRYDRAIVSEIPGTTRDYIEEFAEIGGFKCLLIDTAGLRSTEDQIESIGVQRSYEIAAQADWIWHIYDVTVGYAEPEIKSSAPILVLANKSDLLPTPNPQPLTPNRSTLNPHRLTLPVPISAKTGQGLPDLHDKVKAFAGEPNTLMINSRHTVALERASEALSTCLQTLTHSLPDDLLSVGLMESVHALGEITGETAGADVLDEVFRTFCIGK